MRKRKDWKKLLLQQAKTDNAIILSNIDDNVKRESRVSFKCYCGKEYNKNVRGIIEKSGLYCKECTYNKKINKMKQKCKRLTTKIFIERAIEIHGDKYIYDKVKYIGANVKVIITCKIHGDFPQTPSSHVNNTTGCNDCGIITRGNKRRKSIEQFIIDAVEIHGNKYNYGKVEYINCDTYVTITCKIHGDFPQTPYCHLKGHGCNKCSCIRAGDLTRKTTEQFIIDAVEIHGDTYKYDKVEYINSRTDVIITCKIHGDFLQRPDGHYKSGCNKCSGRYQYTLQDWLIKSKEKHGNKYIYDKVEYINSQLTVIITCKIHGDFPQMATCHLQGSGCGKCSGNIRKTTEQFIKDAIEIHGDKNNYDKVEYVNSGIPVIITCKIHGDFPQRPNSHLRGSGCGRCSNNGYSPSSIVWLEYMMIKDNTFIQHAENEGEHKIEVNGKNTKVDGCASEFNRVYEFHGDYWHGNPKKFNREDMNKTCKKTFGELYDNTIKRTKDIRALGYEVVEMWESDCDIEMCKNYIQYHKLRKELIEHSDIDVEVEDIDEELSPEEQ